MWKMRASGCVGSEGIACLGIDGRVQLWKEFSSMSVYFWSSKDYHIYAVIEFTMCLREAAYHGEEIWALHSARFGVPILAHLPLSVHSLPSHFTLLSTHCPRGQCSYSA